MKFLSSISILTIILMFFSKNLGFSLSTTAQMHEPDIIIHKIIDDTVGIISKKYSLNPCGLGMEGKLEYVEISFQTRRALTKNEARFMLFDCVEIFLKKINNDKEVKPYLKKYPFTYENVGIVFYIEDNSKKEIFHPDIAIAKWTPRGICFKTINRENIFQFKEIIEETLEEALTLIEKTKNTQEKDNFPAKE